MKRILRLLHRFGFIRASVLVLLLPQMAEAATVERPDSCRALTLRPGDGLRDSRPATSRADPALVRTGTPVQDCRDFSNLDRAIQACTRVNASKNLAKRTRSIALSNRCGAYQLKGMADKAIIDCDRAVGLDPSERGGLLQSRPGRAKERRPCPGHRRLQRGDSPLAAFLERLRQVLQQPRRRLCGSRRHRSRHGRFRPGDQPRSELCQGPPQSRRDPFAARRPRPRHRGLQQGARPRSDAGAGPRRPRQCLPA